MYVTKAVYLCQWKCMSKGDITFFFTEYCLEGFSFGKVVII